MAVAEALEAFANEAIPLKQAIERLDEVQRMIEAIPIPDHTRQSWARLIEAITETLYAGTW